MSPADRYGSGRSVSIHADMSVAIIEQCLVKAGAGLCQN